MITHLISYTGARTISDIPQSGTGYLRGAQIDGQYYAPEYSKLAHKAMYACNRFSSFIIRTIGIVDNLIRRYGSSEK